MKTDLSYTIGDMFTTFYPDTPEGEIAWKELAEVTDGTGKVFNQQKDSVLLKLRKAGYTVRKMKKSIQCTQMPKSIERLAKRGHAHL